MSDSENESDFASAESDQEQQETQKHEQVTNDQVSKDSNPEPTEPTTSKENEVKITADTVPDTSPVQDDEQKDPVALEVANLKEEETVKTTSDDSKVEPTVSNSPPKDSGGGWGWGGWGGLWSSVSTVTESAQALGNKVSSVIASVEEGLGLPSPSELANEKETEEANRLAEDIVEHEPPVDQPPVLEEPHHQLSSDTKDTQDTQENKNVETDTQATPDDGSYGGFLTGLASAVQTTGKGLVSGGLDALETLGKKTMEVLSEGDPGLLNKRAMLPGQGPPTLSQLLEEAKNKPEPGSSDSASDVETPLNYSRLFDEYHGVVHLEALELLSKECASKVVSGTPSLVDDELEHLRKKVEELEACFQVEEDQEALDDDSSKLAEILQLFSITKFPLKVDKLIKVSNSWRDKVEQVTSTKVSKTETTPTKVDSEQTTPTEVASEQATPTETDGDEEVKSKESKDPRSTCESLYGNGLRSLAELTSASIELYRKMAELTLLPNAEKTEMIEQAKKFNRLTVLVCTELDCLASVHSEAIAQLDLQDTNSSVTSLYLEASNSCTYVQDAFQLLLPVLKCIQIQQLSAEEPEPHILSRT